MLHRLAPCALAPRSRTRAAPHRLSLSHVPKRSTGRATLEMRKLRACVRSVFDARGLSALSGGAGENRVSALRRGAPDRSLGAGIVLASDGRWRLTQAAGWKMRTAAGAEKRVGVNALHLGACAVAFRGTLFRPRALILFFMRPTGSEKLIFCSGSPLLPWTVPAPNLAPPDFRIVPLYHFPTSL